MSHGKFGTAINCMDGRTQTPVAEWMKKKFNFDYIDTITEPGPDGLMAKQVAATVESIKARVLISVNKHHSDVITVVAHDDCAGNPVSKEEHIEHLRKAMEVVHSWALPVKVFGVWVNDKWEVEEIGA
jgi:hypothetical protein